MDYAFYPSFSVFIGLFFNVLFSRKAQLICFRLNFLWRFKYIYIFLLLISCWAPNLVNINRCKKEQNWTTLLATSLIESQILLPSSSGRLYKEFSAQFMGSIQEGLIFVVVLSS
jgi:hypothetical protein